MYKFLFEFLLSVFWGVCVCVCVYIYIIYIYGIAESNDNPTFNFLMNPKPFPCSLFIWGCAGSALLRVSFSSCGEQGLLSGCVAEASHFGGFSCCSARPLGHTGFSSCGSWAPERRLSS